MKTDSSAPNGDQKKPCNEVLKAKRRTMAGLVGLKMCDREPTLVAIL